MTKLKFIGVLSALAVSITLSAAQAQDPASKQSTFRDTEKRFQDESTNLPSASPRVDKSTPAADPIPRASTRAEKNARFAAEETAYQGYSRSSAAGSKRVNKAEVAADPVPKATTKAEKRQRFAEQEKTLEKQSTP